MSQVFISYARSTAKEAERIARGLRTLGFAVWRDDALPAHRAYAEVIEERLKSARAVVVVWSAEAVKSQWVRAEADLARQARTLVQLSIDGAIPPLPFNQIQCADLRGWNGRGDFPDWRKVVDSVGELVAGATQGAPAGAIPPAAGAGPRRRIVLWATAATALIAVAGFVVWGPLSKAPAPPMRSVVILPIRNLTGDPSLDAVADTLTEDVIDVVGRSGQIVVTPRDTSLALKGKSIDARLLGRQLHVRHVVAASLRKSAPGYRVTFQVVDTASGAVVGAEDVGGTAPDAALAERQLALTLFGATTHIIRKRWVDAELAKAPDDRDPDNIVARLESLDEDVRPRDVGKGQRLVAAGRSAIIRANPIRAEFDMSACNYLSDLIGAGYETSPAQRAAWAAAALDFAAEAAELRPNATTPHVCRAGVFAQLERWEEATAEARHVIAIFPLTANGYGALANVELAQGRFADALKDFTEFAARTDGDPADLGLTHLFLGDYDAAIDALREFAVLKPKNPQAPFFLAAALELTGKHAEAVAQAGVFRRLKSDNSVWKSLALSHEAAFLARARVIQGALHGAGLDQPAAPPPPRATP